MRDRPYIRFLFISIFLTFGAPASAEASVDGEVIRLRADPPSSAPSVEPEQVKVEAPRRGFDYDAFETRLQSLWFQRKTFLADKRLEDAAEQLDKIRTFSNEEGVKRLEHMAGALVAEAHRYAREGNYEQALASLHFASAFDPDRPQIHLSRAEIRRKGEGRYLAATSDLLAGFRAASMRSVRDLSIVHGLAFVVGFGLVCVVVVFSLLMVLRYQVPFRHEVEEWLGRVAHPRWCVTAGWAMLGLPLLIWFGTGWAALYWIAISFRFMARSERLAALVLLVAVTLTPPLYSISVALYGRTANPAARTTMASVAGEYSPDRIVKLRQLVEAHPGDPVYRFLLAGLYKNGRYFEEAFQEYRQVLDINPTLAAAHINVGNIFFATGQYGEAVANYRRAVELDDQSFLAYFNMHLAQSESFNFGAAEESLGAARAIDSNQVADLLSGASGWGDRPAVQDASLKLASVWEAALGGGRPLQLAGTGTVAGPGQWSARLLNPVSLASLLAIVACGALVFFTRGQAPARRCIRCGRPFCHLCKSGQEAKEYCTQCVHLFVLGDGLAPGTKSKKLYEVERQERRVRRTRKLLALVLPGSAHMLRGKMGWGVTLLLAWFAALASCLPQALVPIGTVVGIELRPELMMGAGAVPAAFTANPLALTAVALAPIIWFLGNAWRWRRSEV